MLILHRCLPSLLVSVAHFHHLFFAFVYNMYPQVFLILFIALLYCFFFSYDMYFIYHTFPFIFTAFIHIFIYQKLQSRHTELDCILHIFQS